MRYDTSDLSEDEKAHLARVVRLGDELIEVLEAIGLTRRLSIAKTKVEEAVMWAVRDITE